MKKFNVFDIEGTEFPSGRRTRVMLGDNGAVKSEYFCQGYVVIHPGGSVPLHDHETIESYTILQGTGEITVGEEKAAVIKGDCIYVDRMLPHALVNTGDEDMHMMFVYAPNMIAEHWAQELSGELH
jgi:mannose-6-phosphate isomerase-like protein (cupin superfamily)